MKVNWPEVAELDVAGAIARTRSIARAVEDSQQPWVATSFVTGESLVLGALQREEQVRMRHPGLVQYRTERRATSGVSLLVSKRAIHQVIGVPAASTLYSDAHAGNFINRTVRGLLRAYNGCGAKAHYFGREHFTLSRRPAGVLGLDVTSGGAWVLEAWVGLEAAAPLDGFNGRAPICLREALRDAGSKRADESSMALAERLHERLRGAFEVPAAEQASQEPAPVEMQACPDQRSESERFESREVPIGVVELACRVAEPSGSFHVSFRGDILTSVAASLEFERRLTSGAAERALEAFAGVPFEGAQAADLAALVAGLPEIS